MGNSKSITTSNRLIHYDLMRVLVCFCVIVIHMVFAMTTQPTVRLV
ncbi:hypothetical protein [Ruminococcoides intestinale]